MKHMQIEDETGRYNDQERIDMAARLGVEVVAPIQKEVRTDPVIEEIIDPKTISGDDYDLPWSD
jgi:hypothetical protein